MPKPKGLQKPLKLDAITIDPRLDIRVNGTDGEHAEMLAEAVRGGEKLERITAWVVADPPGLPPGEYTFVTDGRHSIKAYLAAGRATIPATIYRGTWADALSAAAMSNQGKRGKPLTLGDKGRSVQMMLAAHGDGTDEPWSDVRIADWLKVSRSYVQKIRKETQPEGAAKDATGGNPARRLSTDGTSQPVTKKTNLSRLNVALDTVEKNGFVEAADYIWAALRATNLNTVGQAIDHIQGGGLCGLKPTEASDLLGELRRFAGTVPVRESPAPQKPGDAMFDFKRFDSHFGVVVRSADDIRRVRPDLKPDCDRLDFHIGEYLKVWQVVKAQFTRTAQES